MQYPITNKKKPLNERLNFVFGSQSNCGLDKYRFKLRNRFSVMSDFSCVFHWILVPKTIGGFFSRRLLPLNFQRIGSGFKDSDLGIFKEVDQGTFSTMPGFLRRWIFYFSKDLDTQFFNWIWISCFSIGSGLHNKGKILLALSQFIRY